ADDEEINIKLYEHALGEIGYDVVSVRDGNSAINTALEISPDVILLDVMMPELDGLSACKVLKKDMRTKDIPIIIISSKSSTEDIMDGLKAGANEYLPKPFLTEELYLRVNSAVALKKTHDELKMVNSSLEEEVRRQTDVLLEAARFESIGKMASGIGHDLNNLLTGIIGYYNLVSEAKNLDLAKKFNQKQGKSLELCCNFVNNLLNFSKVQKPNRTVFDPRDAVETTLSILSNKLKKHYIDFEIVEDEKAYIYGDEGQFNQICLNIVSNAIDALKLEMKKKRMIKITIKESHCFTEVIFDDNGHGIKKQDIGKIFNYLYSTKSQNQSSGIGLYTTKKIIEGLSGEISAQSHVGKFTRFTISLPKGEKSAAEFIQTSL
ncbi:response regulator, partial [Thermodesulfobacteriota bacterium]